MSVRAASNDVMEIASQTHLLGAEEERAITTRLFWCFAALHVVAWTVLATLTQPNPTLDIMEMLSWGAHLEWGYYKHPPMPAWIARGLNELFGDVSWPIYFVAQLLTMTSIWAAWRMGREILKPWPALAGAMLLEASHYYNFTTTDLNHTITCRPFWALSVLTMYFALTRRNTGYWLLLGVWLGLGMLSKYYMAVLVVSMLGFAIAHVKTRSLLRTSGPYLTAIVALAIFAPHVGWMVATDFMTIDYIFDRGDVDSHWSNHVERPFRFILEQFPAFGPMLLLAVPITTWTWWRSRVQLASAASETPLPAAVRDDLPVEQIRFAQQYLIAVVLLPMAIYFLASAITGVSIRSMWGGPLMTFVGVAWLALVSRLASAQACQRVMVSAVAMGCLFLLAATVRNTFAPVMHGRPTRVHFPGEAISQQVLDRYHEAFGCQPAVIAGEWWTAGNVAHFAEQPYTVYGDLDSEIAPWSSDEELATRGGVIVWDEALRKREHSSKIRRPFPTVEEMQQRFPHAIVLPKLEVATHAIGEVPPVQIGFIMVPPAAATAAASSATAAKKSHTTSVR
ncbi:PMT family 4-amino-4-deoxy-L-arabinose transferase/glycosyltransferase [Pirellula staleyi DSM 6068]|uniref:PMT family 4-amino-4-deoxy-L-arabinose transferase/glycosyltransferase n=1 Tax=Pirellula staleyi (strain ATCC 27377 / DSM 6068 / ICPB 4128) TaxID=530564 RepID=D2R091_PIRSD|nr:glycosyltransferase family 39 protein [Pirellula staleyi]ADB14759.1 PMT family 4-amino-4-deoxy-L-arabinose transferase/glycosyltransferase [Pirellula staleyi DSM 6068]